MEKVDAPPAPGPENAARIEDVLTAVIDDHVTASLADVEAVLVAWRTGTLATPAAYHALAESVAHCEQVIRRVSSCRQSRPAGVLRDAFDAGLLDRAGFVSLVGAQPEAIEPARVTAGPAPAEPDKRAFVEALIARGPAMLHIDARRDGVAVPARFAGEPRLVLRFGHGLTPPIADLAVDDVGVSGTLTFGGVPSHVVLPWAALYAAGLDGETDGTVWHEDVPDEVLEAASGEEPPAPTAVAAPVTRQRGHLTLID